jgi:alkylation response protein AidB-like acyl-CoA dehydrogenase
MSDHWWFVLGLPYHGGQDRTTRRWIRRSECAPHRSKHAWRHRPKNAHRRRRPKQYSILPQTRNLTTVSTYFTFEDVKVPVENLIGKENEGFKVFMTSTTSPLGQSDLDFNHERLGIAIQSLRGSRICLEDAVRHTCKRHVYGKALIEQPVVRYKLANMA